MLNAKNETFEITQISTFPLWQDSCHYLLFNQLVSRYSEERKQQILSKLLPPSNMSVAEVARTEGISEQTLYNWQNKAKQQGRPVPGNKPTSEQWSAEAKLATVIETASLNEAELSEYCRQKGLYV